MSKVCVRPVHSGIDLCLCVEVSGQHRSFPQLLSVLYFETGSLTELGASSLG